PPSSFPHSPAHLDLPSFPTRRSSDLWATHVLADVTDVVVAPDGVDVLQLAMVGINAMTAHQLLRGYGNPAASDRWIGQTAGNSGDRKSTRLNSSHLVISYAVFCLKKK